MTNKKEGGEKKEKRCMGEEVADLLRKTSLCQEISSGIRIFSNNGEKSGNILLNTKKKEE